MLFYRLWNHSVVYRKLSNIIRFLGQEVSRKNVSSINSLFDKTSLNAIKKSYSPIWLNKKNIFSGLVPLVPNLNYTLISRKKIIIVKHNKC